MEKLNLLIVEGNTKEENINFRNAGCIPQSENFKKHIQNLEPHTNFDIVEPGDEKSVAEITKNLKKYDGIVFTGSTLRVNEVSSEVKKHINFLAFIQIPVLIGMISVLPIIREQKTLSDIIIFISTIWLYILIIRSVFVLYGYNLQVKETLYLRYVKSFLIVIFTYIPSTMIFQLFIVSLIKGVVEIWI